MVDHARRKDLTCHVRQLIRADDHAVVAAFEGINEFLHGGLIEIGIIAIQLNRIFTATRVVDSYVPVATNCVPGLVLRNID